MLCPILGDEDRVLSAYKRDKVNKDGNPNLKNGKTYLMKA
jgi:hypothetical protein